MKLTYFQLLSSNPIYIPNVGGIISPKLQDIADIGEQTYQTYLNFLLTDTKQIFEMMGRNEILKCLPEEELSKIDTFQILVANPQTASILQKSIDFFFKEDVVFSEDMRVFEVKGDVYVKENGEMVEKYKTIGIISSENFSDVVDVICQRSNIKSQDINDPKKAKGKKALSILNKLKKGRESMAKTSKTDKNIELGNIISAVANKHPTLNITNIWDLTVYQLWDSFARLTSNNIYDINARSISVWGDKDKKFDFNSWFEKLDG